MVRAVKRRWYHRFKIQAFLTNRGPDWEDFPYQPKYFITLKQASKFQGKLYSDFGPGMSRVVLTSLYGTLQTEMS
jgi:hypothetical protein